MTAFELFEPSLPRVLPLTVWQYEALVEQGLLPRRVELIQGEIVVMPAMGNQHVESIKTLLVQLVLKFAANAQITSQTPVRLSGAHGEPEPDFMLIRQGSKGVTEPEDVYLVIEISKSTYETDKADKLPMYAQHNIPEVWIHNLNNNTLEVYLNPRQSSSGWAYDLPKIYQAGQAVAPKAFLDTSLEWWL
jgi:Uma2 family endonuclease